MLTTTKTIQSRFNIQNCIAQLESRGKQILGEHFKINEQDHYVIIPLFVYFLKDIEAAHNLNISFNKGIMLSGPVGCGKTSLMTVLRTFIEPDKRFNIKPCRQVSFEFHKEGYATLHKYSSAAFMDLRPITHCFDDLGTENNLKYYGNDCNVMAEILLTRYDYFISHKMITHITTNLNSEEIEQQYGQRVRSRMREQFNLLSFNKSTKDKRC